MANEYLNNKVFEATIDRFRKAKENKEFNEAEFKKSQLDLFNAFYTLAGNIIKAFKFQLVDEDDALQEGVMICYEKLHKFDPSIGRAFNFCTTIILNHYRQLYRSARSQNELKIRYHKFLYESAMSNLSSASRSRKLIQKLRQELENTD